MQSNNVAATAGGGAKFLRLRLLQRFASMSKLFSY
jgi:hypothetical protein